jgi:hypothetical protein
MVEKSDSTRVHPNIETLTLEGRRGRKTSADQSACQFKWFWTNQITVNFCVCSFRVAFTPLTQNEDILVVYWFYIESFLRKMVHMPMYFSTLRCFSLTLDFDIENNLFWFWDKLTKWSLQSGVSNPLGNFEKFSIFHILMQYEIGAYDQGMMIYYF